MNKPDTAAGELRSNAPPEDLSPFVSLYVSRRETVDGTIVRLLPELRQSVQICLQDAYWVREQDEGARWRRCPPIALWMPRTRWGYGYVARRVAVFAIGLTPVGLKAVLGHRASVDPNTVLDVGWHAALRGIASDAVAGDFDTWCVSASDALRQVFAEADPNPGVSDKALAVLATDGAGAVDKAARSMQLSTRQFRRRFHEWYGASPKQYQRLIRVDRMLRQLHPRAWETDQFPGVPVPYSDQPHAIREFKLVTGVTPSVYLAQKRVGDRTLRSLPAGTAIRPPLESLPDLADAR